MRRLTAVLLALCLALPMLGAARAEEVLSPAPLTEETDILTGETEDLPKEAEPSSENPMGAPIAAPPAGETEDAGAAEPAPAGDPVEEDVPGAAERMAEFTVTTGEAKDITESSAVLSMTITYPEGWSLSDKVGKSYGFQYCIGNTFDEDRVTDEWESINGEDGSVTVDESQRRISYTGPVVCTPGTTYTCRAYFVIVDGDGSAQMFYAGNTVTFTTGAPEGLKTLTTGAPAAFTLTGGQSAYFTLGEGLTGFYNLTSELPEGVEGWCELTMETDGGWDYVYENDPRWLDGRQHYGKLTLYSYTEEPVTCTAAVTLSPFELTELREDSPADAAGDTFSYFQLPQAAGARYQLAFQLRDAAEDQWGEEGYLELWNAQSRRWEGHTGITDGFVYLLPPESGGTTRYLRVYPYGAESSCTITVSRFSPVTEPVIRSGTPQVRDGFCVNIPVTVQVPPESSQEVFHAWIEYQAGGVTGQRFFYMNSGEVWNAGCAWELLPGLTIRYRAYLERDTGNGPEVAARETEWREYTVPPVETVVLQPGDNTIAFEAGQTALLAFTPGEAGWYTTTVEGGFSVRHWNPGAVEWEYYEFPEEGRTEKLEAGGTLYLMAAPYGDAGTVTVEKFKPSVTGFSIAAEPPAECKDFETWIPLSASVPIGSSFRAGVVLNGRERGDISTETNWTAEAWSNACRLDVLPDTEYKCTPYIEEIDTETRRPIGSRVYGQEITFTTGGFRAEELGHNEYPLNTKLDNRFFYFKASEDGFYEITATNSSSIQDGYLKYWDNSIGGWQVSIIPFSGSAAVRFSAKARVPQYLQIYARDGQPATYRIKSEKLVSTVQNLAAKNVEVATDIPGFTAQVTATVEVPLGQYCRVQLQTIRSSGEWLPSGGGGSVSAAQGETQAVTCMMDTLPNQTYTCRVRLVPTDSNGNELSGAASVYSGEVRFTSGAAAAAAVLTVDGQASGTFQGGRNAYFIFTPPEAGTYQITVTGARLLYISDSDNGSWQSYRDLTQPLALRLEKGAARYLRLSGSRNGPYTIQVSKVVSTVTGFTVTSGEAAATAGELEFTVPVTVTAPIGSNYSCGVWYWLKDSGEKLSLGRGTASSTAETLTYQLKLPAYPGKAYGYRAYVYDRNAKKIYEETEEHTFPMPALTDNPAEITENQAATPQTGRHSYAFTPARSGSYLFKVTGQSGTLTVLRADGTWEQLYYNAGARSADSVTEFNVYLQGGQTAYVILEDWDGSVKTSVTVSHAALTAAWDRSVSSQINVSLDAEAGKRYILAVYDEPGRLLAARVLENPAGLVSTTLNAGSEARSVKAFQLNDANQPQGAAESAAITG